MLISIDDYRLTVSSEFVNRYKNDSANCPFCASDSVDCQIGHPIKNFDKLFKYWMQRIDDTIERRQTELKNSPEVLEIKKQLNLADDDIFVEVVRGRQMATLQSFNQKPVPTYSCDIRTH